MILDLSSFAVLLFMPLCVVLAFLLVFVGPWTYSKLSSADFGGGGQRNPNYKREPRNYRRRGRWERDDDEDDNDDDYEGNDDNYDTKEYSHHQYQRQHQRQHHGHQHDDRYRVMQPEFDYSQQRRQQRFHDNDNDDDNEDDWLWREMTCYLFTFEHILHIERKIASNSKKYSLQWVYDVSRYETSVKYMSNCA